VSKIEGHPLRPEGDSVRTIDWAGDHVVAVDQTMLPGSFEVVALRTVDALVDAIKRLVIRGAPAIGVAGGLGVALAAVNAGRDGGDATVRAGTVPAGTVSAGTMWAGAVRADAARLRAARPTAVNLAWGVDRVLALVDRGTAAMVAEAVAMIAEDIATNERLANRGADLVLELVGDRPVTVHTHCNAGGLACVEWGTALGVVRALHERGRLRSVIADETRPLLQGARLTAFELQQMGAPYQVVVDGAGPSIIARGLVDVVIVGADRVAANGDAANKIGTYPLALAANRAGVPFLVAAPESTIDLATATGDDIPIELRDPAEVLGWHGVVTTPAGADALNPAFDVTPADLVTALVTERRVVRCAAGERPDEGVGCEGPGTGMRRATPARDGTA
jgi:methylthioribose-1-phosphate isomerase